MRAFRTSESAHSYLFRQKAATRCETEGLHMSLDAVGHYRYPAPNLEWLRLRTEEIIEPDLPIIDAHHHIWNEPGNPYFIEDLISDVGSGHRIVGTVYVQCHHAYRDQGPAH